MGDKIPDDAPDEGAKTAAVGGQETSAVEACGNVAAEHPTRTSPAHPAGSEDLLGADSDRNEAKGAVAKPEMRRSSTIGAAACSGASWTRSDAEAASGGRPQSSATRRWGKQ